MRLVNIDVSTFRLFYAMTLPTKKCMCPLPRNEVVTDREMKSTYLNPLKHIEGSMH